MLPDAWASEVDDVWASLDTLVLPDSLALVLVMALLVLDVLAESVWITDVTIHGMSSEVRFLEATSFRRHWRFGLLDGSLGSMFRDLLGSAADDDLAFVPLLDLPFFMVVEREARSEAKVT